MTDDDGVATVLAAAVVGVVVLLLGLALQFGAVVATRHRAESAADLAALAGAVEGVRGREVGCARAGAVAEANGTRMVACTWAGWAVAVRVERECGCPPSVSGPSVGRARAGPGAYARFPNGGQR